MRIFIIMIFAIVGIFDLSAQTVDMGATYTHIFAKGKVRVNSEPNETTGYTYIKEVSGSGQMYGLMAGFYYPVIKLNDDNMSIGPYGGIKIQGYFSKASFGSTLNLGLQAPLVLLYRFGRNAVADNDNDIGFGFGGGAMLHVFNLEYPTETKLTKVAPSVVAEFSVSGYLLRFNYTIGKLNTYYQSNFGEVPKMSYKPVGIDLAFTLPIE